LFLTRRCDTTLPRTAPVHLGLNKGLVNGYSGRHAVNDATNGWTVALAEGRQPE
jgi:hypothetical protein